MRTNSRNVRRDKKHGYDDSKSKRNNSKRSRRSEERDTEGMNNSHPSSLNDISWYAKYPDLLAAAGNLAFPYRAGMHIPLGGYTPSTAGATAVKAAYINLPGVMTLSWMPSIGNATTITDPVNIAAKEIYAKVRASFSGNLEADPQDFMMYLIAMDSLFSYIGALKRIYRTLDAYSPNNMTLPMTLLYGMGFDEVGVQSLIDNKPQFLSYINQLVYQTRKFNMPSVMDIFTRHYWMNDNVYTDAESINSQLYVFRMDKYWIYTDEAMVVDSSGSYVTPATYASGCVLGTSPWVTISGAAMHPKVLYTVGLSMVQALAESDLGYTISGYLGRAYEGANMFVVEPLNGDEVLTPVYAPEVLSQIENSRGILSANGSIASFGLKKNYITQNVNNNTVYFETVTTTANTIYDSSLVTWVPLLQRSYFLSLRTETPTAADVVIATRLMAGAEVVTQGGNVTLITGTEIPLIWMIYRTVVDDNGVIHYVVDKIPSAQSFGAQNTGDRAMDLLIENFDWHPIGMRVYSRKASSTDETLITEVL